MELFLSFLGLIFGLMLYLLVLMVVAGVPTTLIAVLGSILKGSGMRFPFSIAGISVSLVLIKFILEFWFWRLSGMELFLSFLRLMMVAGVSTALIAVLALIIGMLGFILECQGMRFPFSIAGISVSLILIKFILGSWFLMVIFMIIIMSSLVVRKISYVMSDRSFNLLRDKEELLVNFKEPLNKFEIMHQKTLISLDEEPDQEYDTSFIISIISISFIVTGSMLGSWFLMASFMTIAIFSSVLKMIISIWSIVINKISIKRLINNKLLLQTSTNGNTEALHLFLDKEKLLVDLNCQDKDGKTALMISILNNHMQILNILIQAGSDINTIETYSGKTALMIAFEIRNIEAFKRLLLVGANVNIKDYMNGETVLMKASRCGDLELIELILKKAYPKAHSDLQNKNGDTALTIASEKGYKKIVESLILERVDVNKKNRDGDTALMIASRNNLTEIVDILTRATIDLELQNNNGDTALIIASKNSYKKIVKNLILAGADPDLQNKYGDTVFTIAYKNNYTEIVEILKKITNADKILETQYISTLMEASIYGQTQVIKNLISENKVYLDFQSEDGSTALMKASLFGHLEIVNLLISVGVDVNKKNENKYTSLIIASKRKDKRIIESLISAGADPDLQNKHGDTALTIASEKGDKELVELLISANVKLDLRNKDGHTALKLASDSHHIEVVKVLLLAGARE